MDEKKKKQWMKWGKRLFLVLVAVFLARYFYSNYDEYKNLDLDLNWKAFGISVLFYFAYKLMLASLWHYLTWLNEASIPYPNAITAYLCSILGKYIPGKVFMLLARVPDYEERGVKFSKVTICFLIENICTLLGAAFLFLISLFFFPNELLGQYAWISVVLVICFFICIHPRIINFFLKILERFSKKKDLQIPMKYGEMLRVVLLFVANWMVLGGGIYLLTCSIYPVPVDQFLYVSGIYGLSRIIGILAVFAPSGIGVSEGILVIGLSLIMPQEYAVIISLVSRLWVTVAELSLVGMAYIAKAFREIHKREGI